LDGKQNASQVSDAMTSLVVAARSRRAKNRSVRLSGGDGKTWNVVNQAMPRTQIPRSMSNQKVYDIIQTLPDATIIAGSASVPTFGNWNFQLTNLDQASQLAAVFDQYRVAELEVWCYASGIGDNSTIANSSKYLTVIDYDDSNNLSTYNSGLDYTNVVETPIALGHYRRFVPHIAVAAYSGAFTSYKNDTAPWIDLNSLTVQHYGIKAAAQTMTSAINIFLQCRVHLQLRNIR